MGRVRPETGIHQSRPGYYIFDFIDPLTGTKTSRAVGRTVEEANKRRREILNEMDNTGFVLSQRGPVRTVQDLWEQYEKTRRATLSPATMSDYRSMWKKVGRVLGHRQLKSITTDDLRRVLDRIDEPRTGSGQAARDAIHSLSEKRKQNITMFMKSLFTFAVEERHLLVSPAADLKGRRFDEKPIQIPNRATLEVVQQSLPEHYKPLVATMLYSGIRLGEAMALRWDDFDGEGMVSRLHVSRAVSRGKEGPTKGRNTRAIPLPDWLRDDLRIWRAECLARWPETPYMFPGPKGGRLCGDNFRKRAWKPACEAAGVPGLRIHDLRHTYITWLMETGVPVPVLQAVAGHESFSTTRRYINIRDESHRRIADAFER